MVMLQGLIVKGQADSEKRECYDCKHMQAAVSWWCVSEEAKEYRGTGLPSAEGCKFWEAADHIDNLPESPLNPLRKVFSLNTKKVMPVDYIPIDCEKRRESK